MPWNRSKMAMHAWLMDKLIINDEFGDWDMTWNSHAWECCQIVKSPNHTSNLTYILIISFHIQRLRPLGYCVPIIRIFFGGIERQLTDLFNVSLLLVMVVPHFERDRNLSLGQIVSPPHPHARAINLQETFVLL